MILITGAESFIGSELTSKMDRRRIAWAGVDAHARRPRVGRVDIRQHDLARHIPEGTGTVVHLAAVSRDADCRAAAREAFDVNVGGTINLIEAAREKGVRQIIFASTEWVYPDTGRAEPLAESDPIDITAVHGEYALTKLCGERLLAGAVSRGELEAATVLRFGIVYGPRAANYSAVEALFHAVESGRPVEVRGSLRTSRRFIHVSDIADGILAAPGRRGFEVFNLSGGSLISLGEVIREACRITGRRPEVRELNPDSVSIRNPVNDLARETLGWEPRTGLAAGLATLAGVHA
jgi:nucleoside-diphosphate-sugar epimerase